MPTAAGLVAFSAAFHFSAMMSKAWSHDIGVNFAVLVINLPSFMRISGLVRRSSPYMILDRK